MDIVFFGIQGSGKGTQAKKIAAEFEYDIFEAGAELRKIAATDTELGKTVKSFIDQGHLVPHEIIVAVVKAAVSSRPKDQKILFDGIPRDHDQMEAFDMIMHEAGRNFVCVNFTLDHELGMRRVLERAKVEGRADDANEDIIRRRMAWTIQKTMPVVEEYRHQGKVTDIDADHSIEDVYEELKKVLELT
ncbi:MAG: adenylate kinase [Candidatus Peribacteria bacterium]|nr:adenylate kinase [Candidatus Peribacteria bacterium]